MISRTLLFLTLLLFGAFCQDIPTTFPPTNPPTPNPTEPPTTFLPTTLAPTTLPPTTLPPTSAPTSVPSPPPTPSIFQNKIIVTQGNIPTYELYWTVDHSIITFTITAFTEGWLGVGINTRPSMEGADVYIGWVSDEGAYVTDRRAFDHGFPPLDTTISGCSNNVFNITGNRTEVSPRIWKSTISFSRALRTGDTNCDVDIIDSDLWVLWAYAGAKSVIPATPTPRLAKHEARGFVHVNLIDGCSEWHPANNYAIKAHGVLMIVAWLLIIVFGIVTARYMKRIWTKWFRFHLAAQLIAFLFIIIAAFLILSALDWELRLNHPHTVLGFIIVLLTLLQPILGALAYFFFNSHRESTPFFPDKLHWWNGRLLLVLAVVNIFLGVTIFVDVRALAYFILIVWVFVTVLAAVLMEIYIGPQSEPTSEFSGYTKLKEVKQTKGLTEEQEVTDNDESSNQEEDPQQSRASRIVITYIALCVIAAMALSFIVVYDYNAHYAPLPSSLNLCFKFDHERDPEVGAYCKAYVFPLDKSYHLTGLAVTLNETQAIGSIDFYASQFWPTTGSSYFECEEFPEEGVPIFSWSQNEPLFWEFPEDVGFKVGRGGFFFAILRVTYIRNISDSSGVRFALDHSGGINDLGILRISPQIRPSADHAPSSFIATANCDSPIRLPANTNYYIIGALTMMSDTGRNFSIELNKQQTSLPNNTIVLESTSEYTPGHLTFTYFKHHLAPSDTFTSKCHFAYERGVQFTCQTYIIYYGDSDTSLPACRPLSRITH